MAANVTYIPPKAAKPEALRVAAYCRVSSDSSDQLHSYATQIKAYTEQIGAHADWELVDVYADGSSIVGLSQEAPPAGGGLLPGVHGQRGAALQL